MNDVKLLQIIILNFLKMMGVRGYDVKNLLKENSEYQNVFELYKSKNIAIKIKSNNKKKDSYVVFSIFEKQTPKYIKESLSDFDLEKYNKNSDYNIIVILKTPVSPNIRKINININYFSYENLRINILENTLVPKHELITDEDEIMEIMEAYSLKTKYNMPFVLKNDPVSRYFDAKKGNLFKITRISPVAGEYISYRVVC